MFRQHMHRNGQWMVGVQFGQGLTASSQKNRQREERRKERRGMVIGKRKMGNRGRERGREWEIGKGRGLPKKRTPPALAIWDLGTGCVYANGSGQNHRFQLKINGSNLSKNDTNKRINQTMAKPRQVAISNAKLMLQMWERRINGLNANSGWNQNEIIRAILLDVSTKSVGIWVCVCASCNTMLILLDRNNIVTIRWWENAKNGEKQKDN